MDRAQFAHKLGVAIVSAIQGFRAEYPAEVPYGLAIILGQCGDYLGYAVATEQALVQLAAKYDERGYRYEGFEWQAIDNRRELAIWLRWANPDDGWHYGDFPGIANELNELVSSGQFGEQATQLEEFCTDVLASLQTNSNWQHIQRDTPLICGVTEGVDPRDFLRTASRCNPFTIVRKLWAEKHEADERDSRIKRDR
jgi:hypothetical protein